MTAASYDFNATYGPLKVYDQVVEGPCWSFANGLAIAAATLMHTGKQPTWPDDGTSYPHFDYHGYDGVDWSTWESAHYETTIAGVPHTLKKDETLWDYTDPDTLKDHLEHAGFCVISSYMPRSFSVGPSVRPPLIRGYADDEKSNITHAFLGVGYTADGVIMHNSWGLNWGCQGRAILSWPWIAKWVIGIDRLYIDTYPLLGATKAPKPPSWETDMALLIQKTSTGAVWSVTGAFRCWVKDRRVLPRQGLSMADVQVVPATDDIWAYTQVLGELPPGGINA